MCILMIILKYVIHRGECGIYWVSMAGFWMWGAVRVAFLRSCQNLSPCPTEPMPTSSWMDLFLAKVKPISENSTASEITQLRRGKSLLHKCNLERKVRICEKQLCRHRGELRGKGGCFKYQRFPCSPWNSTVEQMSTRNLWRTPYWYRWMPKRGCDSMEGHTGASSWQDL